MNKVDTLKSYVPDFISENIVFSEIYNTHGAECDSINTTMQEILDQCYIDTTTWGLKFWEKFLSIPVDEGKDSEYRRSVIKSKIRGVGTVTKKMIIDTASSYSNGEVEVTEDPANYSFKIKFIGTRGIPANMEDLILTIEEIKPAHLSFTFEYTFMTWNEFNIYNNTWDEWDGLNLSWDELQVYKEVV